jgi:hypothetical protein
MRKECVGTICPNIHKTLEVLWGNSWIPETPTTGVWLFVEGPDHKVRREKVAQYQPQRKMFGRLLSQSPWASWTPKILSAVSGESRPPHLSSWWRGVSGMSVEAIKTQGG